MLHDPPLIVVLFADFHIIGYIHVHLCMYKLIYAIIMGGVFHNCQFYNFQSIHVQRF